MAVNANETAIASGHWWARLMPSKTTALDMLERVIIIGLFGYFAYVNTAGIAMKFDIRGLMLVIGEIMPVTSW